MIGQLYIYDSSENTWVDAGHAFGLSISDGALSALLSPAPMKTYPSNKSRLESGTRYIKVNPKVDERTITLPFHIIAASVNDFVSKYDALMALLRSGEVRIKTSFQSGVIYKLLFQSITSFNYLDGMALFQAKFIEPNPTDRT